MENRLRTLLLEGAAQLGTDLGENEVKLYFKYLDLLMEWNKKMNLTAITDPEEIIIKHFLDSIAVLPYLKENSSLRLLDVGTGAGFPGVPVKISAPEINVVLLDSLNKRVNFLNHVIEELKLQNISCFHGRAEDYGRREGFREAFDIVVSRAVAKLSVLVELCLPFVRVGGEFVSYKGPKGDEEIEEAREAIKILGGKISRQVEIRLPRINDIRTLVFISKEEPTPEKFPRKAGIPEKKPLK